MIRITHVTGYIASAFLAGALLGCNSDKGVMPVALDNGQSAQVIVDELLPGKARDIAVCATNLYCIGTTYSKNSLSSGYDVNRWNPIQKKWEIDPAIKGVRIDVQNNGTVYVVDSVKKIFRKLPGATSWKNIPGPASQTRDIAAGNSDTWIWATDLSGNLYKATYSSTSNPVWKKVSLPIGGKISCVDVDDNGNCVGYYENLSAKTKKLAMVNASTNVVTFAAPIPEADGTILDVTGTSNTVFVLARSLAIGYASLWRWDLASNKWSKEQRMYPERMLPKLSATLAVQTAVPVPAFDVYVGSTAEIRKLYLQ